MRKLPLGFHLFDVQRLDLNMSSMSVQTLSQVGIKPEKLALLLEGRGIFQVELTCLRNCR